jgi:pSer/pThr/pTyr-binding forkhead associated (FHA) protein
VHRDREFAPPLRLISAMNDQALELYRKACGLNAPLVLECDGASRSASTSFLRTFDCPFVLIGRDPRSDFVLDISTVSRRHVFLHAIGGRLLVIDLQSRTKVYWEGEDSARDRGWLDPGQFIQVGPYRIRQSAGDAGANLDHALPALLAPQQQERTEAAPMPRAALELPIRTSESRSLWPVGAEFAMVGGSDECQLVLNDESVSRQHAALVPTPLGVWVVDLMTREGVHVNGARVRWAWLADGDSLRIGRLAFILRYEIPPDNLTRQDIPLEAGAIRVERPGTELAVSSGHSKNARYALVARSGDPSPLALHAASPRRAFEPPALVPSDRAEWESAMPHPMNSMSMWQQQMQLMETFHNDMIIMVQMFATMHRQQLDSVRHEMDMVQRLTGQLQDLQNKVVHPAGSADVGRPAEKRASASPPDRKKRDGKPASQDPSDVAKPKAPSSPPPARGPTQQSPKARSARQPVPPAPQSMGETDDPEVFAHLTRRISELQRERQGYWQRILSVLHN